MKVIIEIVKGVEGDCLVINDRRVAGPKPWGGGTVTKTFTAEVEEIKEAIELLPIS